MDMTKESQSFKAQTGYLVSNLMLLSVFSIIPGQYVDHVFIAATFIGMDNLFRGLWCQRMVLESAELTAWLVYQ
jgi:hypothetical protein